MLQAKRTLTSVFGRLSEVVDSLILKLLDDGRAIVEGPSTAVGSYEVAENGELTLRNLPMLPPTMRIIQPWYRALANPSLAYRALEAAERATLPEPVGLGTASVTFPASFPAAGLTGVSLAVTVRDAAGTVFVAIPETPYDASDVATVARPIGLPIAAGHAAEVEVRVRLRDGEGRTRCFIARASVSVQHAQETSLELAPQEAACE